MRRDDRFVVRPEQGLTSVLAKIGAIVAGVAGILVWASGQLAGLVVGHVWLRLGASEVVGILLRLPAHLDDPAQAWPAAMQAALPGPVGMYTAAVVVLAAAAIAGGLLLRVWDRQRFGWHRGRPRTRPSLGGPRARRLVVRRPNRRRYLAARARWLLGRPARTLARRLTHGHRERLA